MATAEISYRCALCGAALRSGMVACPNCGPREARPVRRPPAVTAAIPVITTSAWFLQPDLPIGAATPAPSAEPIVPPLPVIQDETPTPLPAPRYEPVPLPENPEPAPPTAVAEMPVVPEIPQAVYELPAPLADEPPAQARAPVLAEPQPIPAVGIKTPVAVQILAQPAGRKRSQRRRYGPPTMKERLLYRWEQLRDATHHFSRRVAPTVTQARRASNKVLDNASEDPSARFVLISLLLIGIAALVLAFAFFFGK